MGTRHRRRAAALAPRRGRPLDLLRPLNWRAKQVDRRHEGEEPDSGFTMVEVIVAIGIFAAVLTSTTIGAVDSMNSALLVREHSIATSLISGTISQAEAMPFSAVQAGLNPNLAADPLASDPNVTTSTSGGNTVYTLKLNGQPIAACSSTTAEPPLVPHVTSVILGITYKVAAYPTVTSATCGQNPQLVTLVVVVSWTLPTGSTTQLVGDSQIAAP